MRIVRSLSFALAAIALLGATVPGRSARACGGFFGKGVLSPERRPSLAYEQVLLIHDREAGREHFIREVAFRRAQETFGFVVPTPTRPEVARVSTSPFV